MGISLYAAWTHEGLRLASGDVIARLTQRQGTVQYRPRDILIWDYAKRDQSLHDADVVATGERSNATISFDSGHQIEMRENSQITLATSSEGGQHIVTLLKGHIDVSSSSHTALHKDAKNLFVKAGISFIALDRPDIAMTLRRSLEESTTMVLVTRGVVQATTPSSTYTLTADSPRKTWIDPPSDTTIPQSEVHSISTATASLPRFLPTAKTLKLASRALVLNDQELSPPKAPDESPKKAAEAALLPAHAASGLSTSPGHGDGSTRPTATNDSPRPLPASPHNQATQTASSEEPLPTITHEDHTARPSGSDANFLSANDAPSVDLSWALSLRYGKPLSKDPVLAKVNYVGMSADLLTPSTISLRTGVDVFTRGTATTNNTTASFESQRIFVGLVFKKRLPHIGLQLDLNPKLTAATSKATLQEGEPGQLRRGEITSTKALGLGVDLTSELDMSVLTLRLNIGQATYLGSDRGIGSRHVNLGSEAVFQTYRWSPGAQLSLLLFTRFETAVHHGDQQEKAEHIEILEYSHAYVGSGLEISW